MGASIQTAEAAENAISRFFATHAPKFTEAKQAAQEAAAAAHETGDHASIPCKEKTKAELLTWLTGLSPKEAKQLRGKLHAQGIKREHNDLAEDFQHDPKKIFMEGSESEQAALRALLKFKAADFEKAASSYDAVASEHAKNLAGLKTLQEELGAHQEDLEKYIAVASTRGLHLPHKIQPDGSNAHVIIADLTGQLETRIQSARDLGEKAGQYAAAYRKMAELRISPTRARFKAIFGDKPGENSFNALNQGMMVLSLPSMLMMVGSWIPRKPPTESPDQQQQGGPQAALQTESPVDMGAANGDNGSSNPVPSFRPRAVINQAAQQLNAQKAQAAAGPSPMQSAQLPPSIDTPQPAFSGTALPLSTPGYNTPLGQAFTGHPSAYGNPSVTA